MEVTLFSICFTLSQTVAKSGNGIAIRKTAFGWLTFWFASLHWEQRASSSVVRLCPVFFLTSSLNSKSPSPLPLILLSFWWEILLYSEGRELMDILLILKEIIQAIAYLLFKSSSVHLSHFLSKRFCIELWLTRYLGKWLGFQLESQKWLINGYSVNPKLLRIERVWGSFNCISKYFRP